MVRVVLFIDGEVRDSMDREIVPRVGETIVLDCGDMVKVFVVNHDWDNPSFVQVNAKACTPEEEET